VKKVRLRQFLFVAIAKKLTDPLVAISVLVRGRGIET
jgi:hypothetical protein